ncbi:conserved membrane hypothetical protein [uncultured Alphaproteobacteria bacterium]|uniref:Uncharacterized protein n=1 Tax=uncultured Alphaproteobacteria bacterium TaxID=91750 RepID=A0A212KCS6_9PROT|nr:conserved membrane hypothetical protein [uncultured Alphaproteobacteria bacterium]
MKKIRHSLTVTGFFVVSLITIYIIHIKFFYVDVIFYAAILDAFIATALSAAILFGISYFTTLNGFEKLQLTAIWLLAGYAFAISVPTVIDRSLSFYILEKLDQRGGGIRSDQFENVFTKEYMNEYRLVDVRLTEQEQSGTIVIEDGCVILTPKGRFIASISSYFRHHLLPKKRLLRGEYTDVLTDPFKNSTNMPSYQCGLHDTN